MVDRSGSGSETLTAWIRAAFWVGHPRDEAAFHAAIDGDLLPALRALPGVEQADSLWPRKFEDDPPAIHCQILVFFRSRDALDRMLGSPERAALRGQVRALADTFVGTISHIDYEVG